MGAWIEILGIIPKEDVKSVAPAWGRGLKSLIDVRLAHDHQSPPHGGVD